MSVFAVQLSGISQNLILFSSPLTLREKVMWDRGNKVGEAHLGGHQLTGR